MKLKQKKNEEQVLPAQRKNECTTKISESTLDIHFSGKKNIGKHIVVPGVCRKHELENTFCKTGAGRYDILTYILSIVHALVKRLVTVDIAAMVGI